MENSFSDCYTDVCWKDLALPFTEAAIGDDIAFVAQAGMFIVMGGTMVLGMTRHHW